MGRALTKSASGVRLVRSEAPRPTRDEVLIRVGCAGICRTDLHVADGSIEAPEGRVLGHELAGTIHAVGAAARGFRVGDRVSVFPIIGCGECAHCADEAPFRCALATMLGVGRDGAFRDFLRVPARAVHHLPEGLSLRRGAYAEPVAASLAVLRARPTEGARGVILGRGRIAELTRRVLSHAGTTVPLHDLTGDPPIARGSLDFVIETVATEQSLALALFALVPGGTLILKSRPARPVALDVARAVSREINIRAVAYGSMTEALRLLGDGLPVDDLLGPTYDLEDHERAFEEARRSEDHKVFLRMAAP